jgi:hypothetical protein
MKRAFPVLFDTLSALALAVWLGGLVAFFAVVEAGVPGKALNSILTRVGGLIEVCGIVMIGVQFLMRRRYQRSRSLFISDGVRQLLTFAALFVAEFGRYGPLRVLGTEGAGQTHALQVYTSLAILQIALLVGVIALTAWLQQPRPAIASAPAPTPTAPAPAPARARTPRKTHK